MYSALGQNYYEVLPSDKGTLKVGIFTEPEKPVEGDETRFKIHFINPKTDKIQEHIDYRLIIQKDGNRIIGSPNLIHTSEGTLSIKVDSIESGIYFVLIEMEGILFQPIDKEVVSFTIPIGNAEGSVNGNTPENDGGCLIATATFGSELSPQVQQLREFRDNVVLNTQSGKAFMTGFNEIYYSFSPAIADYERENSFFRDAVKIVITPLLTTLSLLHYIDIDTEDEILVYGISIIALNAGMYFAIPAIAITKWYKFRKNR